MPTRRRAHSGHGECEIPVEPLWLKPQSGDPECQGKHEGYPLAVLPGQPGTGFLQAVRIRAVTPVRGHDLERGQHPAACRIGEPGREVNVPVGAHRAAASGDPAEHLRARPLPAGRRRRCACCHRCCQRLLTGRGHSASFMAESVLNLSGELTYSRLVGVLAGWHGGRL